MWARLPWSCSQQALGPSVLTYAQSRQMQTEAPEFARLETVVDTDINGLRLHAHFDEGTGPAIVMLHGINSDGGDWRTVIDTIGPGYRFIAFDLLGFGKSPKPLDIDYSADEHALVIENTLRIWASTTRSCSPATRSAATSRCATRRRTRTACAASSCSTRRSTCRLGAGRAAGLQASSTLTSRRRGGCGTGSPPPSRRTASSTRSRPASGEAALEDAFHADDIPTHWEIMSKNLTNTINAATWVDDLPKLTHAGGPRDRRARRDREDQPGAGAQAPQARHGDPQDRRARRRPHGAVEHARAGRRGDHARRGPRAQRRVARRQRRAARAAARPARPRRGAGFPPPRCWPARTTSPSSTCSASATRPRRSACTTRSPTTSRRCSERSARCGAPTAPSPSSARASARRWRSGAPRPFPTAAPASSRSRRRCSSPGPRSTISRRTSARRG